MILRDSLTIALQRKEIRFSLDYMLVAVSIELATAERETNSRVIALFF